MVQRKLNKTLVNLNYDLFTVKPLMFGLKNFYNRKLMITYPNSLIYQTRFNKRF